MYNINQPQYVQAIDELLVEVATTSVVVIISEIAKYPLRKKSFLFAHSASAHINTVCAPGVIKL